MINIAIGDKEYKVKEAKTEEEKFKGLLGIEKLPEDEGMIFYFDEPENVNFWMKDCKISLDIVFINENKEVISVKTGKPDDETFIEEANVKYVVEVNANSGIESGDDLFFLDEEKDYVMKVLAPDGTSLMNLEGGERIFSRKSTLTLIKKAKRARANEGDPKKFESYCKQLGKYIFKELDAQDNRKPEYVESPK